MKKVDSKPHKETLEEEVKRLRKENAKLKSQKAAKEAKLKETRKELKKKDVKTVTVTEEQMKLLSTLFPDIDSRPLKSPFLRDIVQVQYLAYFLKHAQKSFHSSFEVICCCREKYVHSISYHTLIKVAAQTIIRL